MELLCRNNSVSCFDCQNQEKPLIEYLEVMEKTQRNIHINEQTIVFILKGSVSMSGKRLPENMISLLNIGLRCICEISAGSELIIFRLGNLKTICDYFSVKKLIQKNKDVIFLKKSNPLDIRQEFNAFIESIKVYSSAGMKCPYLFNTKLHELKFLLWTCYSEKELLCFFKPVITDDAFFTEAVLSSYHKAANVEQLAYLTNYSLSGFEKRFRRIFGVSAGKWLRKQKSVAIYQEIMDAKKTFKDICFEYGFSSASHFNDYCKLQFGATPGQLRKI